VLTRPVDGLPTWVRRIVMAAVGPGPIQTFWMGRVLGRYLRVGIDSQH
jgi:hypothetical protein